MKMDKYKSMAEIMSASELKGKLFKYFHESGSLDNLRCQLRSQLASEMLDKKVNSPPTQSGETGDMLLPLQVSNWLVYDHLKRLNFEYSLSIFMSEANLSDPKKLLSIKDILKITGINEGSSNYNNLLSSYEKCSKESFLYLFFSSLSKYRNSVPKTEGTNEGKDRIVLEGQRQVNLDGTQPSLSFGPYFSVMEGSVEKNSTFNRENGLLYQQLQLEKQRHAAEMLNLQQKLLQEVDSLHKREYAQKLLLEKEKNRLIQEQSLVSMERERLKIKELELQRKTDALHRENNEKIKRVSQEFLEKPRQEEYHDWEFKVREQQQWLETEIQKIKTQATEINMLRQKITEVEESYKNLNQEYSELNQENASLRMKINSMSDYTIVKEELSLKTKKLMNAEMQISKLKSEVESEKRASFDIIRKLQQEIIQSLPKTEYQPLTTTHLAPTMLNQEKILTEEENKDTKGFCQAVLQRLQEQKDDIQELHRLICNLHHSPNQSKDAKKNTECSLCQNFLSDPASKFKNHRVIDIHKKDAKQKSSNFSLKYENVASQFIADARKRISKLENESRALEIKCAEVINAVPTLASSTAYTLISSLPSQNVQEVYARITQQPEQKNSFSYRDFVGRHKSSLKATDTFIGKDLSKYFHNWGVDQVRNVDVATGKDSILESKSSDMKITSNNFVLEDKDFLSASVLNTRNQTFVKKGIATDQFSGASSSFSNINNTDLQNEAVNVSKFNVANTGSHIHESVLESPSLVDVSGGNSYASDQHKNGNELIKTTDKSNSIPSHEIRDHEEELGQSEKNKIVEPKSCKTNLETRMNFAPENINHKTSSNKGAEFGEKVSSDRLERVSNTDEIPDNNIEDLKTSKLPEPEPKANIPFRLPFQKQQSFFAAAVVSEKEPDLDLDALLKDDDAANKYPSQLHVSAAENASKPSILSQKVSEEMKTDGKNVEDHTKETNLHGSQMSCSKSSISDSEKIEHEDISHDESDFENIEAKSQSLSELEISANELSDLHVSIGTDEELKDRNEDW